MQLNAGVGQTTGITFAIDFDDSLPHAYATVIRRVCTALAITASTALIAVACNGETRVDGRAEPEANQSSSSDTFQAREPDSLAATDCLLGWKTVLGDSTVSIATLDLRGLAVATASPRPATVWHHLLGPRSGHALTFTVRSGALRESFIGALDSRIDSTSVVAVIAAVDDSSVAQVYADRVNAAISGCRAGSPASAR